MVIRLRGLLAFNPGNVLIAAHVTDCTQTSCSMDYIFQRYSSTRIIHGCHLHRVAVETSLCFVGLKFEGLIFRELFL